MAGIKLELTDLPEFTDSLEITIVVKKDGTIIQRVVPNPPSPQQPSYVPPYIPNTPPINPGYIGDPPPGTIPNITCDTKGRFSGSVPASPNITVSRGVGGRNDVTSNQNVMSSPTDQQQPPGIVPSMLQEF